MPDRLTGLDLHLERQRWDRLSDGLAEAIRHAVASGRLQPGSRLPSARSLAEDLGIARNTVARVYADLTLEGVLAARRGSGTAVAAEPFHRVPLPVQPSLPRPGLEHDLRPGRPDVASFPRSEWRRAMTHALASATDNDLGYGDPRGHPALRETLAGYLSRARGLRCGPDDVVVCTGATEGVELVARALAARDHRVMAVESHGLPLLRERVARAGLTTVPLDVDSDGAVVAQIDDTGRVGAASGMGGVGSVMLTPAHQFPLGSALSKERRGTVAAWARRTGGVIIEDDYDGEFRYDRRAFGALQGLAPDHVVYVGSASKALAPGLRIGWLVVPGWLRDDVVAQKGALETTSGVFEQLAFERFVAGGGYDRHVRARRVGYAARRRHLVTTLAQRCPAVEIVGLPAGLHLTAMVGRAQGQGQPEDRWTRMGVRLLGDYRHPAAPTGGAGLVIGFGAASDSAYPSAVQALVAELVSALR